jgi:hypothetical protein
VLNGGTPVTPVVGYASKLLTTVWLLIPVAILLHLTLSTAGEITYQRCKMGISFLLTWTSLAAFMFAIVSANQRSIFLLGLPMWTMDAVAILLILWGWSQRWYLSIAVLGAAIVVDTFGHQLAFDALRPFHDEDGILILTYPVGDSLSYLSGQNLFIWIAFGVSKLLGIVITFGNGNEEKCVDSRELDTDQPIVSKNA